MRRAPLLAYYLSDTVLLCKNTNPECARAHYVSLLTCIQGQELETGHYGSYLHHRN